MKSAGENSFETAKPARRRSPAAALPDRLPPHSLEAEAGLLGCALLSPAAVLDDFEEAGVKPDWCYDLRHQVLLHHLLAMHLEGCTIDAITLRERLKQTNTLDDAGGDVYLAALADATPSAANAPQYLEIVREHWQRRTLIQLCTEATVRAYELDGDTPAMLATAHAQFLRLEETAARGGERPIKQILLDEVLPELESHYTRGRAQIKGMTTGLEYYDKILCGMGGKRGRYYVIAARPNVGKTSLITQIAMHVACDYLWWEEVDQATADREQAAGQRTVKTDAGKFLVERKGVPVGISSMEMEADALVEKMLFQRKGVDLQSWRTGFASEGDVRMLNKAGTELGARNNIYIDDTPRLTIGQLKARWRRWCRQYGVRLFIADYIQLMQPDKRVGRIDRQQEIADISAELQALGKELKCPLIILAQMNRDYEKDPNRAPRMSDLKDSGALEQDADVITFLYEPKLGDENKEFFASCMQSVFSKDDQGRYRDWKKWSGKPQRINALVAKNRRGPKGKAELLLLHSSTTFVDWNRWLKDNHFKKTAAGEPHVAGEDPDEPTEEE